MPTVLAIIVLIVIYISEKLQQRKASKDHKAHVEELKRMGLK